MNMRTIHASAAETLTNVGYTVKEAKRIRPFLPKHFTLQHPALPRSNVDFWLACMAVNHFISVSSRRGRFYSDRGVGFWAYNNIRYVCEDFQVEFSEVEFIRQFGDGLYTDFSEAVGHRVVGTNPDGSLKVKSRHLQIRLRQIDEELKEQADYQSSFGWHFTTYQVGHLMLPPEGNPNAKAVIDMYTHGLMAEEYQTDQNGRKMLLGQLDFVMVARYLYFLELCKIRKMDILESSYARYTILNNFLGRSPSSSLLPVQVRRDFFYVPNKGFFTPEGWVQLTIYPQQHQFSYTETSRLVRCVYNGANAICPTIPESVYDLYSEDEWKAAISN